MNNQSEVKSQEFVIAEEITRKLLDDHSPQECAVILTLVEANIREFCGSNLDQAEKSFCMHKDVLSQFNDCMNGGAKTPSNH